MKRTILKNATIINEGLSFQADVLIENEWIAEISSKGIAADNAEVIDLQGMWLLPGVIDDQVHFREPGLTHKADLTTESRAALLGGVTTYMEMPNTIPQAVTLALLEEKYSRAAAVSAVNYSFFLGGTNHNVEEVKKMNIKNICGLKIFMGSSTGDMLVDNPDSLEKHFKFSPTLIATHCEDESTIKRNLLLAKEKFGEDIPPNWHPIIRDEQACIISSTFAMKLAKENNTRLHILHITTAEEAAMFDSSLPLSQKKITAEVCVHHLHFTADDYDKHGNDIKCNPAIKGARHKTALWDALLSDRIDIIATDHAPHTREEKNGKYAQAPSGLPLIQHTLNLMLEYASKGFITIERVVEKMCHAPAICFQIEKRGFIREGYYADLVAVNPSKGLLVKAEDLAYKCKWSPFEGHQFEQSIQHVWVNGTCSLKNGKITEQFNPQRITFNR